MRVRMARVMRLYCFSLPIRAPQKHAGSLFRPALYLWCPSFSRCARDGVWEVRGGRSPVALRELRGCDGTSAAAVSGADPIDTRPGFAELLDRIEGNGVRTVIVEDASRFARELMTQELGILALIRRDVRVLTANGDDLTDSSDPSRKMMRQIAGAFHEYEKARLVAKLKAARERKRETEGKCEGRKSWAEINPDLVREAKRLRRRSPKGHQRSLRDVAAELASLASSISAAPSSRHRRCSR